MWPKIKLTGDEFKLRCYLWKHTLMVYQLEKKKVESRFMEAKSHNSHRLRRGHHSNGPSKRSLYGHFNVEK